MDGTKIDRFGYGRNTEYLDEKVNQELPLARKMARTVPSHISSCKAFLGINKMSGFESQNVQRFAFF